jgi:hypothetical protein
MTVEPIRNARAMLSGMDPRLDPREYLFCATVDAALAARAASVAIGVFREEEGHSLILEASEARALGFAEAAPMRRITLNVFSALDGVGLTAAVATAFADEGIPCNVVAAFHHDHLFVPAETAERALQVLRDLQAKAGEAGR